MRTHNFHSSAFCSLRTAHQPRAAMPYSSQGWKNQSRYFYFKCCSSGQGCARLPGLPFGVPRQAKQRQQKLDDIIHQWQLQAFKPLLCGSTTPTTEPDEPSHKQDGLRVDPSLPSSPTRTRHREMTTTRFHALLLKSFYSCRRTACSPQGTKHSMTKKRTHANTANWVSLDTYVHPKTQVVPALHVTSRH